MTWPAAVFASVVVVSVVFVLREIIEAVREVRLAELRRERRRN